MGKRSEFERRPNDKYLTPYKGVPPLLSHIPHVKRFVEPCAGDRRLVHHLERHGLECVKSFDIEPETLFAGTGNALSDQIPECDAIITNPPWSRDELHPMIRRFMQEAPETWLLFDADWIHTDQRGAVDELMPHCSHIVAIGRLKWIDNSPHSGKDNCCWYRFSKSHSDGPKFYWKDWKAV